MKMGFRTPSPKRSFSARTTGRLNRTVKKATNPLYGKKGMGYINNPKKAVYNKIYNQTTTSIIKTSSKSATINKNIEPSTSSISTNTSTKSIRDLSSLTLVDLQTILRTNGLNASGNKQELIQRISENASQISFDTAALLDKRSFCPICGKSFYTKTHCTTCNEELIPAYKYLQYENPDVSNNTTSDSDNKGAGVASGLFIGIYCCPLLIFGIGLIFTSLNWIGVLLLTLYALFVWLGYHFGKK